MFLDGSKWDPMWVESRARCPLWFMLAGFKGSTADHQLPVLFLNWWI